MNSQPSTPQQVTTPNEVSAEPAHRERRKMFDLRHYATHSIPERRVVARSEMIRVARLCGRPDGVAPTPAEFDRHARLSRAAVRRLLGLPSKSKLLGQSSAPWRDVVERAGLTPAHHHTFGLNQKRMEADLVRVANKLGRWPTTAEYTADPDRQFYWTAIHKRCGGWNQLARKLGYRVKPVASRNGVYTHSDEELVSALRRWALDHGYRSGGPGPGHAMFGYKRRGSGQLPLSSDSYVRRFGTWVEALRRAGFQPPVSGPLPKQATAA